MSGTIENKKNKLKRAVQEMIDNNYDADSIIKFAVTTVYVTKQGSGLIYKEIKEVINEVINEVKDQNEL